MYFRTNLVGTLGTAGSPPASRPPAPAGDELWPLGSRSWCFSSSFALQAPAAAQVAAGGVMRFATDEVAFIGGFAGVAADVWLIEPFGYLSHDAGVWAIQAGASVPVVRLETVRVSIRLGTSTAIAGPAVEPNVHPTIGAGVRIGRRFGVLAEVDRARAFRLLRGGLFVGW